MAATREIAYPKRGEIYLVRFDPTQGAEIQKTLPALILQNDLANRQSPVTIVAPIHLSAPRTGLSDKDLGPGLAKVV
jgi:mRNA interferase MazF